MIFALALGLSVPLTNYAQNEVDALRYSSLHLGGTARYVGLGGAFGAVGADIGTLTVNPAGIGKFSKSEVTFTPGVRFDDVEASFLGSTAAGSRYNMTINNAGLVGVYNFDEDDFTMWRSVQFGIAYNRTGTFHSDMIVQGENPDNTLLDIFTEQSNGLAPENLNAFGSYLAWESWATSPVDTVNYNYYHELIGQAVNQRKTVYASGSMGETALTLGGNYNNKVLIGFTLGFPNVKYMEQSNHSEEVVNDSTATLRSFSYRQNLTTRGVGINAKFGVIYMPVPFIRLGIAAHTPTRLALTDRWSSSMSTAFTDGRAYDVASPQGDYDYTITTPGRVIGSAAVIIMKSGLISVDYELVDYAGSKLRSASFAAETAYDYANENLAIKENYTSTSNIRIGAEWRLAPFTIRGGYALYGSPYRQEVVTNDGTRTSYSLGAGYRENGFFMDVAYVLTQWKEDYYLYDANLVEGAVLDRSVSQFLVTVGFRY